MTEIRLDAGTVASVRRTPQGGLRVDARLTRVGVLTYRNADGTARREFRPPEEVFAATSLDSLRGAPVTDLHPSEMVRTDNHAVLARGHVGDDVREDAGTYVAATLYVQDGRLVEMVERGDRREISCGYVCDFDPTPGEFEGQRYDGVQRNITYNHAALGPREWGRAGSEVALRMDAADVWTSAVDEAEGDTMKKRKDEGEVVAPAPAADAPPADDKPTQDAPTCEHCGAPVNAEGKYAAPAPEVEDGGDAVPEEKMDAIKARLDARDAEVSDLRRRLDEANDPKRLAALVADVVSVREVAARAGVERTDSTDSKALRAAVVEKVLGLRCDGKSADYVTASFDAAVKVLEQRGVGRARATVDGGADALPAGGLIADLHRSAAAHVQKSNHEKGGR